MEQSKKIVDCLNAALDIINDPKFYKEYGVTRDQCREWLDEVEQF